MAELKLLKNDVVSINFSKNPQPGIKLNVMTSISYNVKFVSSQNKCLGDALILLQDPEHKDVFSLELHMVGIFDHNYPEMNTDTKRIVHVETAKILYPFWNTVLGNVLTTIGAPPMVLQPMNINPEDVLIRE
ncbi:MAG: protein-export chaperone SecB [Clostridia bacterium]|nr:protein-export chaperone SecB [Clostridia bacterium]